MTPIDLSQVHLLDAIDHAVTVLTRGVVVLWNPGAEKLFGWSADEAIGRNISELVFTEVPSENEAISEALSKGQPWSGDYHSRRKDGSTVLIHSSVSHVRNTRGRGRRRRHRFERRLRASLAGRDVAPRRGALAERLRDRPHGRVDVGRHDRRRHAGTSTWRPATA